MKHQPETEEQRLWYWRGYAAGVNGLAERVSELIERQFGVKLGDGLKPLKTNAGDPYETTAERVERARWNSQFQNCPCGDSARPGHPMGWCEQHAPKMWGNTNAPGAVWVGNEPPTPEQVKEAASKICPECGAASLSWCRPGCPRITPPSGAEKVSRCTCHTNIGAECPEHGWH